jgi:hypothetical protein
MTLETTSFAEGAIEVMFLQQQGAIHLPQPQTIRLCNGGFDRMGPPLEPQTAD